METNWHTVVPTTLGRLTLVRDEDALRGLYYPNHWYSPDPTTFGPRRDVGFDDAVGQLGEYLAGRRKEFDVQAAPRGGAFQKRVWNLVQEVPYGETVSYGELARHLGREATAQQVGAAVGRNPLCIVIPCHRVVGATGKLTGYAGGHTRKRILLELEQQVGQATLMPLTCPAASVPSHGPDGAGVSVP